MGALFAPDQTADRQLALGDIRSSGQAPGGPSQAQVRQERIASKLAFLNGEMTADQKLAAAKASMTSQATLDAGAQAKAKAGQGNNRKSTFLGSALDVSQPATTKTILGGF